MGIFFAIVVLILTFVLTAFARSHDHPEGEMLESESTPTERP
ncbi:MAG: hypothetical protein QM589_07280 [Thermomicrobiales bacterium]